MARRILAGENRARNSDPSTSHEAAEYANKKRGKKDRLILELLAEAGKGGLTTKETSELHPALIHNNISPRFKPLEERGWIYRTRRKRKHEHTNCKSIVWRITDAGRAEL